MSIISERYEHHVSVIYIILDIAEVVVAILDLVPRYHYEHRALIFTIGEIGDGTRIRISICGNEVVESAALPIVYVFHVIPETFQIDGRASTIQVFRMQHLPVVASIRRIAGEVIDESVGDQVVALVSGIRVI